MPVNPDERGEDNNWPALTNHCSIALVSGPPHPMVLSLSESWSSFNICLEKLMGEVLGKECKHQICALGIRNELSS